MVIDRYWQADTAAEEEEPHNIYCQWSVYPLQKGNLVCDGELFWNAALYVRQNVIFIIRKCRFLNRS